MTYLHFIKNISKIQDKNIKYMKKNNLPTLKPSLNWLSKHLSIDEFKSVKSVDYAMSCVIIDNEKRRLIDVIEDRKQTSLYDYFMRYDLSVRKKVKTITMDMNGAYYHFLPKLFPNAIVIIDRFHLVQRLNVALNRVRLQVMKEFKYTQPTHYRKLKNLWKLLLKHEQGFSYIQKGT